MLLAGLVVLYVECILELLLSQLGGLLALG